MHCSMLCPGSSAEVNKVLGRYVIPADLSMVCTYCLLIALCSLTVLIILQLRAWKFISSLKSPNSFGFIGFLGSSCSTTVPLKSIGELLVGYSPGGRKGWDCPLTGVPYDPLLSHHCSSVLSFVLIMWHVPASIWQYSLWRNVSVGQIIMAWQLYAKLLMHFRGNYLTWEQDNSFNV